MADTQPAPARTGDRLGKADRRLRTRRWMSHLRAASRVLAGSAAVLVLYFALPFSNLKNKSAWFVLALLLAVCVGLMAWQTRAIIDAVDPRMRAVEALAVSIPLLLVSFATVHFLIGQSNPDAYTEPLTRTDALYFSVTVLSTVGFGDISAVTQAARIVVTVQMLVNLLVLGVGIRIILGAVELGRQRAVTPPAPAHGSRLTTSDE
jgi:voltage-gated potassium channel